MTSKAMDPQENVKLNPSSDPESPGSVTPLGAQKTPSVSTEKDSAITSASVRYLILSLTLFENLVFSGIVFGWPALFYMLKTEKIYQHLCKTVVWTEAGAGGPTNAQGDILGSLNGTAPNESLSMIKLDCSRQENVLNSAYTIGIFAMGFTSFLWGFMLDSYGIRFVRLALNFLITLGCALLWLTSEDNSFLIIPAIVLLGLIGVPLRIANMQIADYYPRKRSTVITVFSGAFSASPVVFVLCKYAYDHLDLSYRAVMSAPLVLSFIMLPTTFYFLPKHSVRNREAKLWQRWETYRRALGLEALEDENQVPSHVAVQTKPKCINKTKLMALLEQQQAKENGDLRGHSKTGSVLELFLKSKEKGEEEEERQCLNEQSEGSSGCASSTPMIQKAVIVPAGELSKSTSQSTSFCTKFGQLFRGASAQDDVPLRVSLYSFSFLSHQLWFSWLNTYMVLYSGSLVLWLARVTDDREATRAFTQAFGLVQVSAILFAPMAGYIMDRSVASAFGEPNTERRRLCQAQAGFIPILITTATLTVASFCRFFDTSAAVYASLVFITLLRSFLIAVASAYIRVRFPASHFSRLNGIMCTTGAFFSLLQSPLFYFEAQSNEMAFYVNLFCAFMTALSWLNPLCLGITSLQKSLLRSEGDYTERLQKEKAARQAGKTSDV